jgi:hypothetical protein
MKSYFFALLLILPGFLAAQTNQKILFKVVSMLGDFNINKTQLNAALASATSKEVVKKIIREKKLTAGTIVIKVIPPAGDFYYWPLGLGRADEDDHIVLQSRTSTSLNFYQLVDFKTLFKDTLVLLDTLSITMYLHDDDYPDNNFVVIDRCNKVAPRPKAIPLCGDKLLIVSGLIEDCNEIFIFNTSNNDRELAHCWMRFLNQNDKEQLQKLSRDLQADQPTLKLNEKAMALDGYIRLKYGTVYFPQLVEFAGTN